MSSTRSAAAWLWCLVFTLAMAPLASHAAPAAPPPPRTLDDYRHFRSATIDLLGRLPTRDEIEAFERPNFDFDGWIDQHLAGSAYVERLTRIYMDLLRLEPNVTYFAGPSQLSRRKVTGPDGQSVDVVYRQSQRRMPEAVDGQFCFTRDEMFVPPPEPKPAPGAKPVAAAPNAAKPAAPAAPATTATTATTAPAGAKPATTAPAGAKPATTAPGTTAKPATTIPPPPPPPPRVFAAPVPKKISQKLLDERTVLVRPWWLYRDYRDSHPNQRYQEAWKDAEPDYHPVQTLLVDAAGKRIDEVRVCREEAQGEAQGHVYASGRTRYPPYVPPKPGMAPVFRTFAPIDSAFATAHKGEPVACGSKTALASSVDCGCGHGLERCMPSDADFGGGMAFEFPNHMPLGPGLPIDRKPQSSMRWYPYWWSREVVHFLGYLFEADRDFREILTGKETLVNGPLAQFYRTVQRGNCCGLESTFGMTEETEPLFDPQKVPFDLLPHDVGTWRVVADRGPHAAGLLTMPMFLEKYASARARGNAVYNAFLCKSFVAENVQLTPSTEDNLMLRPGCSTCHSVLEPLAAYFSRVEPGNFVFLPASKLPAMNPLCKKAGKGLSGNPGCNFFYDAAFADDKGAMLRSAYGSPKNADATPAGAGAEISSMPEFSECAVSRVTSSFLGRPVNADDEILLKELGAAFRGSGFKMRTLVRGILRSNAYRKANNLSSTSWRGGGDAPPPAATTPTRGATPPVSGSPHGTTPERGGDEP